MVKGKGGDFTPLDVEEDFNNPTVAPGTPAEEAVGKDLTVDDIQTNAEEFAGKVAEPREPKQATLPGTEAAPDPNEPLFVRNGQMLAEFVEAILDRAKDGSPLIKFRFSFMLTPEHEAHLPREVVEAWNVVKQGHCKRYDIIEVPPATITVNEVPDDDDDLRIVAAIIEKPMLAVIEETGAGKSKTGIRFSFTAVTDREAAPTEFAIRHDSKGVWITMVTTQGRL